MGANTISEQIFPNKASFDRAYEDYLETSPQAPETLRKAYSDMYDSFEHYLAEYGECAFRYAYECGYKAALARQAQTLPTVKDSDVSVAVVKPLVRVDRIERQLPVMGVAY